MHYSAIFLAYSSCCFGTKGSNLTSILFVPYLLSWGHACRCCRQISRHSMPGGCAGTLFERPSGGAATVKFLHILLSIPASPHLTWCILHYSLVADYGVRRLTLSLSPGHLAEHDTLGIE